MLFWSASEARNGHGVMSESAGVSAAFQKTVASPGRLFYPASIVQPFLLVRQRTPCGFHPQQGKLCLLVFGALGKEGAVLGVIAIFVRQTHAA
jgi:hypothetical protein